jgi:hypothetical protein
MKEEIIQYLSQCNLVELNHILSSALTNRSDSTVNKVDDEYSYQSKLLLCEASREKFGELTWEPWKVSLIAAEDKSQYDNTWETGNGEPFFQEGECASCEVELAGHAKKSTCPLCGKYVPLT